MTVKGEATISLANCRMQGYKADAPINAHPKAKISAFGCIDRYNNFFEMKP